MMIGQLGWDKDLGIDDIAQKVIIKNIMNIALRCTYYVFC